MDSAFSLSVAASFADDDTAHGDSLSFQATLADDGPLPGWLLFDPLSGAFSGTPTSADLGLIDVKVTATDALGPLSASDSFQISVTDLAPPPPTVVEVRIAASTDDAEERSSGSVSLTSSDIELVDDDTSAGQTVGLRFAGLDIPQGAVITNAYIQFQVDETDTRATALLIRGEDTDNAATFSAASFGVSSRTTTASSVAWAPPAWTTVGEAGLDQRTPDLSAIVQEIVDRSGWLPSNALALVVTGSGERTAEAYDSAPAGAPLLHVEYLDAGSVINQAPSDITLDNAAIAENSALGAVVGTAGATDPDAGDSHGYSLVDDAGGRFAIDPQTGVVTVAGPLDHEAAASHDIVVRATDSGFPARSLSITN
jgi:hypothetical protein